MVTTLRRSVWSRVYATATWTLIVLFVILAGAHLVLTVLFYLGVWEQGVGYVFDYEWPGWLITIIDALAAFLLWTGYRRGSDTPWLGLTLTSLASLIMLARASWMVFVPVSMVLTISGSIGRIVTSRSHAGVRA
ncbi:MAG TPA: hypothetical protein VMS99_10415 [Acidimicrobiia bacterium]|nr:hypothetical protein [Acidimicrobiia bacterium]